MKKLTNSYGKMMVLIGFLVGLPAIMVLFDKSQMDCLNAFLIPSIASIVVGLLICIIFRQGHDASFIDDDKKNSFKILLFAWFYCFFLGAMPFMIGHKLNFIQALFESVSGYTTTGLTVVIPEQLESIYLLHRTLTQYAGGFGLVLMLLIVVKDSSANNLYSSEGHVEKFMPSIQRTSRAIFYTYNILIIVGTLGFMLLGMNIFESFCHATCSLFTGGFSPKNLGIAYYNSVPISMWSVLLMFLGSINTVVILMMVKGKFKQASKNSELNFLITLIVSSIIISIISLLVFSNESISTSIYYAICNIVSAFSTCGNFYNDLSIMPQMFVTIIIIGMIIGGCAGSTTGGIKVFRLLVLVKSMINNFKIRTSSQHRVLTTNIEDSSGTTIITDDVVKDSLSFIGYYFIILLVGTFLLMFSCQCSLIEGLFEFSSSLGGVGLSIGLTGPSTSAITLIIEMIGMILGRLEIFGLLIGIYYIIKK